MPKARLTLLLLLSCFALLGAECDGDGIGKGPLPDRADAANPLLRHYFDTNTFPAEMRPLKIPEGKRLDGNNMLIRELEMGGGEIVTEVRVTLFLVPPGIESASEPDVQVRVIAPDGTTSRWEYVDFIINEGPLINHNVEVVYGEDFDGVISTGTWQIQLRDPIPDEDGRCLFRNATLRLNGGLPTGATTGTETVLFDLLNGEYNRRMVEIEAPRSLGDLGHIGAKKPLRMEFTFATAFNVTGFTLQFTVRSNPSADITVDLYIGILSPSGGWLIGRGTPFEELSDGNVKWSTFILGSTNTFPPIGNSFAFQGEPSAGTWSVLLWDGNNDEDAIYLSPDEVQVGVLVQNQEAFLSLD
jgi:hypothetical protein